ncbi:MAG: hypothetical protein AAGB16_09030, partial [Pseudomonadota bacterium]
APSGDLFLIEADGAVERVSLMHGEGLAPLRYADLKPDRDCTTESICAFNQADRLILFVRTPEPQTCADMRSADLVLALVALPKCASDLRGRVLLWSDVLRENGVTLTLGRERIHKIQKPDCLRRPWRTCGTDLPGS